MDVVALLFYKIYHLLFVYHNYIHTFINPSIPAIKVTATVLNPASQPDYTLHNPRETATSHHSSVPSRQEDRRGDAPTTSVRCSRR